MSVPYPSASPSSALPRLASHGAPLPTHASTSTHQAQPKVSRRRDTSTLNNPSPLKKARPSSTLPSEPPISSASSSSSSSGGWFGAPSPHISRRPLATPQMQQLGLASPAMSSPASSSFSSLSAFTSPSSCVSTPGSFAEPWHSPTAFALPRSAMGEASSLVLFNTEDGDGALERVFSFLTPLELARARVVSSHWNECSKESTALSVAYSKGQHAMEIIRTLSSEQSRARHAVVGCMARQSEVDVTTRASTVDWMGNMVIRYGYHIQTQFLAIRLLDRMLAAVAVPKRELPLLGAACVLLAAKLEETRCPSLRDLAAAAENLLRTGLGFSSKLRVSPRTRALYTSGSLTLMETSVMRTLDFTLHSPTIATFLVLFLDYDSAPPKVSSLSYFLAEQSLLYHEVSNFDPLHAAAAIVCLAAHTCKVPYGNLLELTGLTRASLRQVGAFLLAIQGEAERVPLQEIRRSYATGRHFFVGNWKPDMSFLQVPPSERRPSEMSDSGSDSATTPPRLTRSNKSAAAAAAAAAASY